VGEKGAKKGIRKEVGAGEDMRTHRTRAPFTKAPPPLGEFRDQGSDNQAKYINQGTDRNVLIILAGVH